MSDPDLQPVPDQEPRTPAEEIGLIDNAFIVQRSDGRRETGWSVDHLFDADGVAMAEITRPRDLHKTLPADELMSWQDADTKRSALEPRQGSSSEPPTPAEMLGLQNKAFRVARSDGSVETGWSVGYLFHDKDDKLMAVILKQEMLSKGMPVQKLLSWQNAEGDGSERAIALPPVSEPVQQVGHVAVGAASSESPAPDVGSPELRPSSEDPDAKRSLSIAAVEEGQSSSEPVIGVITETEQAGAEQALESVAKAEASGTSEPEPLQLFESPDTFERALDVGKVGGKLRTLQEAWTRAHDAMKGNVLWGEEAQPKLNALRGAFPELTGRIRDVTGMLQDTQGLLTDSLLYAIRDEDTNRTAQISATVTDNINNAYNQIRRIQDSELDALRPSLATLAEDWDTAYSRALGRQAGGELTEHERDEMLQECRQWAENGMTLDDIVGRQVARADAVSARWRQRQEFLDEIRAITYRLNSVADDLGVSSLVYEWDRQRDQINSSYGEPRMATDFANGNQMQELLETLDRLRTFASHAEAQLEASA